MPIKLYDLTGREDRRFSPNCWRTRMALAHKGLAHEAVPTRFTQIASIANGFQVTLPVIEDGGRVVADSWAIAQYLENHYPDHPTLFGGEQGMRLTLFVQNWVTTVLHAGLIYMIILDIHDHLQPEDKDDFRASREKRFGASLESLQAGRDDRLKLFRSSLPPLRSMVQDKPYLGGEMPLYADYLVFGAFQWSRVVSPFRLLDTDDPVLKWFGRCLNLYDGLGRSTPGYD